MVFFYVFLIVWNSFYGISMLGLCSVLTPYYKEDVVYSRDDLMTENEDGISVLFYLQKIYPGLYKEGAFCAIPLNSR
jgi:hypothetical protein